MIDIRSFLPELYMGLSSLLVHKLRSLLTMMGMIFGVGAVVAMLSITAGAQKEMISFIDLLGVNNIIIEAKEAVDRNELQTRRAISPGLTFRDYRAIEENVPGIEAIDPAQALQALQGAAQDQPGPARADRRAAELPADQQPEVGGGPLLQRRGQRDLRPGLRAGRDRQGQSAGLSSRPSASTSRSTTSGCR